MRRRIGLGVLAVLAMLGGCSTSTTDTSTTAKTPQSLNATPCNYARAWHDDPSGFSEFALLARYARSAESAQLRAEGQQLASSVSSLNTAAISEAAGTLFSTCKRLGFVPSLSVTPSTTG